jgi:UDP-glucuronate 4-epimerase
MHAGKPIPVFGDGTMQRDYTFIDDIINGVRSAIDRCAGFAIYNLGNSSPVSLSELILTIESAMGRRAIIERLPLQPGDVNRTFADTTLARRDLGFHPGTDFKTGIAEFIRWFKERA